MRRRTAVALAIALLAVGGCASGVSHGQPGAGDVPAAFSSPAARDAAQALLGAWTAAHPPTAVRELVVTDGLLGQVGDWTDGDDPGGQKLAFVDVAIRIPAGVVPTGQPVGTVAWADGVTRTGDVLAPSAALDQARAGSVAPPPDPPLVVTGIGAATTRVVTAQGPATVPAWDLGLARTPVHVMVVATSVAATGGAAVGTPASSTALGGGLVRVDDARVGVDGRTLTVSFVGAPDPASVFCGEDYTAFTVANERAIVLVVVRHPYGGPPPSPPPGVDAVGCSAVGAARQATTVLDAPWAGRPVLDAFSAMPVPTTA